MSSLLAFLGLVAAPVPAPDPPPNLVVIVVDDLGWADVSPNRPETFYDTPNVARLAGEGLRFTQGYATCPVCSPTRASLMVGRWPQRTGITDYISPGGGNQPGKWKRDTPLLPAPYADRLALEEETVAERLRARGYATFFAGKWHLGPEGHWPEDQGFDENLGGIERGGPYGGKKYFSPYGNPRLSDGPEGEHLPARLAAETVRFMTEHREEPFLAWLSFYSVHTPLIGRPDLVAKYEERAAALEHEGERWRPEGARRTRIVQDHAVYAAMVEAMDQALGEVLGALDQLGLAKNTLVVFTSDNGGLSTSEGHPTSNEPLRAGKGWLYEGGVRVPWIVRWPGRATPGAVCDEPIASVDLAPTLLAAAGVDGAPLEAMGLDGLDLAPLFEGERTLERDALYWHYPHYGNQGGSPGGAVRAGRFKLVERYEDGGLELYDLEADPSERSDLSDAQPERAAALAARLAAWRAEVGARMPTQR